MGYYLKALQQFKIGEALQKEFPQDQKVLAEAGYTYQEEIDGGWQRETVTFILKNVPKETTCVSITSNGRFAVKDNFCSQIARTGSTGASEARVVMNALPGMPKTEEKPNPETAMLIEGVQKLYACYTQTKGSDSCAKTTGVEKTLTTIKDRIAKQEKEYATKTAAKEKQEQKEKLEGYRESVDQTWKWTESLMKEAKERAGGWFSDVKPDEIQTILDRYRANPYEGGSLEETLKGRADKAKEMKKSIVGTASYNAIVKERADEQKTKAEQEVAEKNYRERPECVAGEHWVPHQGSGGRCVEDLKTKWPGWNK
ncbi:MAG: hypothetical protein Q7T03_10845 [Deltaproteobacteria bacterium]|nr:hypothetical protein [Deltaproteobacteria bacterium]